MEKSLFFKLILCYILILCKSILICGQSVVFSENFSGFITGTHTTPSTSDVSGSLDTRTLTPGWTGLKVYSAGGEVKLGTSELSGWIETPLISFSGHAGGLILKFDISCWPGDGTIVNVLLNGSQLGNSITPTDEFKTIEIPVTPGIVSGNIKFIAVSKRFFIDNVVIFSQNVTSTFKFLPEPAEISIYPNPSFESVTILNSGKYEILQISDLTGKIYKTLRIFREEKIELTLNDLTPGIYFFRFISGKNIYETRILKLR